MPAAEEGRHASPNGRTHLSHEVHISKCSTRAFRPEGAGSTCHGSAYELGDSVPSRHIGSHRATTDVPLGRTSAVHIRLWGAGVTRFTRKVRNGRRHPRKQESHQHYTRELQTEGDAEGVSVGCRFSNSVQLKYNVLSSRCFLIQYCV